MEDEVRLFISNDKIVIEYRQDEYLLRDSLPANMQHKNDSVLITESGDLEQIHIKGDTIIRKRVELDTKFNMQNCDILKKYKGHYFLNKLVGENAWEVKKLTYTKGLLTVSYLSSE